MGELKKYKEQVMTMVSGSSKKQKILFLSVTGLVLLGLAFFIFWISKPEYSILFTDLSTEDASEVVLKLKEGNVEYKLTDSGATILVPVEKVYELRLELASQGLPKKGTVGFEIFDKTNFGMTEFTEKMDYQRALQGELARTINQMEGVKESRIHLTIPQTRLFTEMEKDATASVVLYMESGRNLNPSQIQGIVHLVSSSVEGLKPENVSVLDSQGRVFSVDLKKGENEVSDAVIAGYYELKENLERQLQRKVQSLLDSMVGENRTIVQVSVEINMNTKEINKETYIPIKGNIGVLRSEQILEEKYKGNGEKPATVSTGTDQTVPSYPSVETGEGKNDYKRSESISNYEVSTETTKETAIPGDIKFISVGVGIDKNLGLNEEELAGIKDLVASSIGLNSTRGDQIKVTSLAFFNTSSGESGEEGGKESGKGMIPLTYLYYLLGFLAIVAIIAVLFTRKTDRAIKEEATIRISEVTSEGADEPAAIEDKKAEARKMIARDDSIDISIEAQKILSIEDKYKNKLIEEYLSNVKQVVSEKPEEMAVLFKVWIAEDD